MRFAPIAALVAAAALAAPAASALAASPLTGETLPATVTTTNGSASVFRTCAQRYVTRADVAFNASGNATGPYAGSFVETQGSASVFQTIIHNQGSYFDLSVPFTITSGARTITGTLSHSQTTLQPQFLEGFGFLCNGPTVAGLTVSTPATYSATVQVGGETPQAISGQANVSGNLYTQPGAQTTFTASFTG